MRNFIEEIKNIEVDDKYDITPEEYLLIDEQSGSSRFALMRNCFLVGYLQGRRAGIAEIRKAQA